MATFGSTCFSVGLFDPGRVGKQDGWDFVDLTPKQTFWICNQLQENVLLRSKIRVEAKRLAGKLRDSADEIDKLADEDGVFITGDRRNKIFDLELGELHGESLTNERILALYRYRNEGHILHG